MLSAVRWDIEGVWSGGLIWFRKCLTISCCPTWFGHIIVVCGLNNVQRCLDAFWKCSHLVRWNSNVDDPYRPPYWCIHPDVINMKWIVSVITTQYYRVCIQLIYIYIYTCYTFDQSENTSFGTAFLSIVKRTGTHIIHFQSHSYKSWNLYV